MLIDGLHLLATGKHIGVRPRPWVSLLGMTAVDARLGPMFIIVGITWLVLLKLY
jgi:hypothetical protein